MDKLKQVKFSRLFAKENSLRLAKLIKRTKFHVHASDHLGNPLLVLAVLLGNTSILKSLLEKGLDPNFKGDAGETPLMWAVNKADVQLVNLLVAYGADPHVATDLDPTDEHYCTALSLAKELGYADIIDVLEKA